MLGVILGGRYVIGEQVGVGGMGVVHVAKDLMGAERVAVKLLHRKHAVGGVEARHLEREARIGRVIRHPNVVAVLDTGRIEGRPFVVMEYVDGRPLSAKPAERRSLARVSAIASQILGGLDAIHRAGFIHGDLKSDNVLLGRHRGRAEAATIIDLGLARGRFDGREGPPAGQRGQRMLSGTPDYVAPELFEGGRKTIASDLYAVGVILYELLTGTTPFGGGTSLEILARHVSDAVVPPSRRCPGLEISTRFEQVILRALEKRPQARYPTASAFAAALVAATGTIPHAEPGRAQVSDSTQTLEWPVPSRPPPARPLAATSDPDQIIVTALAAARTEIGRHQLLAAAHELEVALERVDAMMTDAPGSWRLLVSLAGLYDGLGDPGRARRTARMALERAARTHSAEGRTRAKALIVRFADRRCV